MNDEIMNEIEKAAELLGMSLDDAKARFEEICSKNNVDAEKEPLLARSLWRQFFSNSRNVMKRQQTQPTGQQSDGLYKKAFGFFVALNDAIDMSARSRDRLTNEYMRDSDMTYSLGRVAIFTEDGDGYEARMMRDGEEIVKHMKKLPENNVEVDSGRFIVPLDTRQGDWNKNYGKPQPASEYQRKGVFVGEVNGKMGKYFFSYKKDACVNFQPKTFEFIHFDVIPNSNREDLIHGGANQTVESLVYNADLADDSEMKRDVSQIAALQGAGAAGVIGGIGKVAQAGAAADLQLAAAAGQQQYQRDLAVAQDGQGIEQRSATRGLPTETTAFA